MEPTTELTLSVLVTREEYCEAAAEHRRAVSRGQGNALLAAGAVLTALGIAGVFFGGRISLSFSAAFSLIVLGIFLVCYNGVFAPMFSRAAAAREYDRNEDLRFATAYRFSGKAEGTVMVKNGRMEGNLPLRCITEWTETPSLFLITYGREFRFAIPKRLLEPGQEERLRSLLPEKTVGIRK